MPKHHFVCYQQQGLLHQGHERERANFELQNEIAAQNPLPENPLNSTQNEQQSANVQTTAHQVGQELAQQQN